MADTVLSLQETSSFFTRLMYFYSSGIPIETALDEMAANAHNARVRRSVESAKRSIQSGKSLSAALSLSALITPLQAKLIAAAEETGGLDKALPILAQDAQRQHSFNRNLLMRLSYPAVVIITVIMIVPLHTFFTGGIGGYFRAAVLPFLGFALLIGAVFLFIRFMSDSGSSRRIARDRLLLRVPILRQFLRFMSWSRFSRIFAMGYSCGIALTDTASYALSGMNNQAIEYQYKGLINSIKKGIPLTDYFNKNAGDLPFGFLESISTGEKSGTLDKLLYKLAEELEEEASRRLTQFSAFISGASFMTAAAYAAYNIITFYLGYLSKLDIN
ncbi:membrane protein containing Type II secretion system F domain protein [Candidatus Magnetoovum chiemensis]|nr:membrane protein containing Type II secretion system F domain protein [Candidatus Magnetoovum chiemensis]